MVEDEGRGQPKPGGGVETVTEFHGRQRVEAQLLERPLRLHRTLIRMTEHAG